MASAGKDFLKGNDKDGETRKNAKLKERRNTGLQRAENRRNAERRDRKKLKDAELKDTEQKDAEQKDGKRPKDAERRNRKKPKAPERRNGKSRKVSMGADETGESGRWTVNAGEREIWRPGNMLYPLPAVMVSCARPGERPNIITIAWTGTICSSPAMVSISVRPERYSYDIIKETGEFVINLTTERLVRAADFCGVRSGRDVDKFQEMHLTAGKASVVQAPVILESPVNIECRVEQILELGSHHMFLARVEAVDIDSRFLSENGRLELNKSGLAVYSHGEYFGLGEKVGSFGVTTQPNG